MEREHARNTWRHLPLLFRLGISSSRRRRGTILCLSLAVDGTLAHAGLERRQLILKGVAVLFLGGANSGGEDGSNKRGRYTG